VRSEVWEGSRVWRFFSFFPLSLSSFSSILSLLPLPYIPDTSLSLPLISPSRHRPLLSTRQLETLSGLVFLSLHDDPDFAPGLALPSPGAFTAFRFPFSLAGHV
jgi:hypothetical protein